MNYRLVLTLTLVILLSSCVNAAMTSAQAVYDRHNLKQTLNDQYITMRAYRTLYLDTEQYKNTHVSVSSFNNVVLLTGQVPSIQFQQEIEDKIRRIPHIKKLHNLITVSNPPSILTQMSDTWITTKIKTKLIANNDIDPGKIKVVTENGNVYLMGIIPPDQARIAVQIARSTQGVQNVIKIFSYLRISTT